MGDRRFDRSYEKVHSARDPAAAIAGLSDTEVVHALAAASRRLDAYFANVLAVEVLNRRRLERARLWGMLAGLAGLVVLGTILIFVDTMGGPQLLGLPLWVASPLSIFPAVALGLVVYLSLRRRPLA